MARITVLIVCLFALSGCKEQVLYSDLNEQEANEIVAVLYASGLAANKVSEKGGVFRVDTNAESFAGAMAVLQSQGLPRKRFVSLGDVFAKEGFVSSPLEERARLNHALSEELSHTLSTIDGVIVARVHLAVPEKEHLSETHAPSSASIFVKHRFDVDLTGSVSKIKALVVDGVENLPYENVTVALFAAEAPAKIEHQPLQEQVLKAGLQIDRNLIVAGAAGLILFGMLSLAFSRLARQRRMVSARAAQDAINKHSTG
jgi:type III secretion protein J